MHGTQGDLASVLTTAPDEDYGCRGLEKATATTSTTNTTETHDGVTLGLAQVSRSRYVSKDRQRWRRYEHAWKTSEVRWDPWDGVLEWWDHGGDYASRGAQVAMAADASERHHRGLRRLRAYKQWLRRQYQRAHLHRDQRFGTVPSDNRIMVAGLNVTGQPWHFTISYPIA